MKAGYKNKAKILVSPLVSTVVLLSVILIAAGCTSIKQSEAIDISAKQQGITPINALPKELPGGMSRFEDSLFVFVHAEQASELLAGLVVPVPFVTDAVINSVKRSHAMEDQKHYLTIKLFDTVSKGLKPHPNFKASGGEYSLYPFVVMEECIDDVYRLSLVFQVEKNDWMGRYFYHLPTTIPAADIGNPSESEIATFERELKKGTEILLGLLDSALEGKYLQDHPTATIGSLYIVGSKIGGLANPNIFVVKDAQIMQETEDAYIMRLSGMPSAKANSGGLAFGVHYFKKEQLHTFKPDVP